MGVAAEKEAIQVGAASATINPPSGVFLAGYDHNRRSTGVHDDLYVKAVVFCDGRAAVALVVLDCFGLQYDTVEAIRAAASAGMKAANAERNCIVVQATHSHCTPDTAGIYGPDETHTGRDDAYMTQLVETSARVVGQAAKALKPARIVYAETQCTGWAVNDSEPGVVDNSVTILQCLDQQEKSMVTLTNFACHPTVLDGDTTQVSADWVGSFYKGMTALPGEHLFLQGAIGCWIQPETPERTFALAEKYGKDLAEKTLAALRNPKALTDATVRCACKKFSMPVENEKFVMMSTLGLIPRKIDTTADTEVAWFAVGPAQFATHPGETAPLYSKQAKALMKTGPKFILGLGLDHLGYICPPEYFGSITIKFADYLTGMSPGPHAGAAMMAALQSIIGF